MSAATALSSFNQAESQHAAANPMNSYAQSPFQADVIPEEEIQSFQKKGEQGWTYLT